LGWFRVSEDERRNVWFASSCSVQSVFFCRCGVAPSLLSISWILFKALMCPVVCFDSSVVNRQKRDSFHDFECKFAAFFRITKILFVFFLSARSRVVKAWSVNGRWAWQSIRWCGLVFCLETFRAMLCFVVFCVVVPACGAFLHSTPQVLSKHVKRVCMPLQLVLAEQERVAGCLLKPFLVWFLRTRTIY